MLYVYLVASAVLLLVGEMLFGVMQQSWSWWAVPLMFVALVLIFIIIHITVLVLSILIIDLNKPQKNGEKYYRFLVKISVPLIFKLAGIKINSSGAEKLPQDTRFMLICNHQHDFDPAIIYHEFPDADIAFIGKKEIYTQLVFIAKIMHKLQCMPIDRENNREAAKTIVNAAKLIKSGSNSVAIFPEGYTSPTCELLPFRNGAFKIAYKANVPIVACVINNTRSIVPNLLKRKTVVDFRVVDVIYPESFSEIGTVELGEMLYDKMNAVLKELQSKE